MSRASPGSFAGYFPTAPSVRRQDLSSAQRHNPEHIARDSPECAKTPKADPPVDRALHHGDQYVRQYLAHDSDLSVSDRDAPHSHSNGAGDILNGVGSASSLGSSASSVFTRASYPTMHTQTDTTGGLHTLTPLTNHESSPTRRSPTPSYQKLESTSKHVSSRDAQSSVSNGLDAPPLLSSITPTPTPPTTRIEARPGPGEVKGRRIILDPELGPGKAQKIKKATYRDFGAQVCFVSLTCIL